MLNMILIYVIRMSFSTFYLVYLKNIVYKFALFFKILFFLKTYSCLHCFSLILKNKYFEKEK